MIGADGANGTTATSVRPRAGHRARRRLRGKRPLRRSFAGALRAPRRASSSATSRAATAGSLRRATTSTSASAPGRAKALASASTSRASASRTISTRRSSRTLRGHRLPLRRPGARDRRRARAARRRRRRPDRPGFGRRDVRVLRLVEACHRRGARPARRADVVARAVRGCGRRRADAASQRLVEAEAGARPLAASLLAGRSHRNCSGRRSSGSCWASSRRADRPAGPRAASPPGAGRSRPLLKGRGRSCRQRLSVWNSTICCGVPSTPARPIST